MIDARILKLSQAIDSLSVDPMRWRVVDFTSDINPDPDRYCYEVSPECPDPEDCRGHWDQSLTWIEGPEYALSPGEDYSYWRPSDAHAIVGAVRFARPGVTLAMIVSQYLDGEITPRHFNERARELIVEITHSQMVGDKGAET